MSDRELWKQNCTTWIWWPKVIVLTIFHPGYSQSGGNGIWWRTCLILSNTFKSHPWLISTLIMWANIDYYIFFLLSKMDADDFNSLLWCQRIIVRMSLNTLPTINMHWISPSPIPAHHYRITHLIIYIFSPASKVLCL